MSITIETIYIDHVTILGPAAPALQWHVGPIAQKGGRMPIEVTMTNEEKVRLQITPMTPGGQPAPVDGPALWTVEGTCTVEPVDDTSAWILSGSAIGDSTITVACDADLGEGTMPLGDVCLVHVNNPMAAQLGLAADAPVLKST